MQVMLGVSLRARWDATLVIIIMQQNNFIQVPGDPGLILDSTSANYKRLSYVTWTFNVGRPFWFMEQLHNLSPKCRRLSMHTETNPIVFISHIIAPDMIDNKI